MLIAWPVRTRQYILERRSNGFNLRRHYEDVGAIEQNIETQKQTVAQEYVLPCEYAAVAVVLAMRRAPANK